MPIVESISLASEKERNEKLEKIIDILADIPISEAIGVIDKAKSDLILLSDISVASLPNYSELRQWLRSARDRV